MQKNNKAQEKIVRKLSGIREEDEDVFWPKTLYESRYQLIIRFLNACNKKVS